LSLPRSVPRLRGEDRPADAQAYALEQNTADGRESKLSLLGLSIPCAPLVISGQDRYGALSQLARAFSVALVTKRGIT